jgi:hypothetical protein
MHALHQTALKVDFFVSKKWNLQVQPSAKLPPPSLTVGHRQQLKFAGAGSF